MIFQYIKTENKYPFDRHLIDGIRELGHRVEEIEIQGSRFGKYILLFKNLLKIHRKDIVFIGYSSPYIAIISGIFFMVSRQKNIFNAVHSQYEANVISRKSSRFSIRAIKFWLSDFLSFHLSGKILFESDAQIKYIHKLTLLPMKKMVRSFTGVNEKDFYLNKNIKKLSKFTVLFRGRFLPESGIETVVQTAHILDGTGIQFRIIGHGYLHVEYNKIKDALDPKNMEELTKTLPIEELRDKMQECHISLGQLAINDRLERTLPCKIFESLSMGLPYLTGRNAGALELLTEDKTCFCVEPGNAEDLAKKILFLRDNPHQLEVVAENGYVLYKEKLTSKHLAEDLLKRCF